MTTDQITFPEQGKGTYILILQLPETKALVIGSHGLLTFPKGWYTYVGNAFGAGGLRGRLKHHLATEHPLHWHIDYLRQAATINEIWYVASLAKYEHQWASTLSTLPDASIPAKRFGSSDCHCPTHLFHFPAKPDFTRFCENLLEHDPVHCWKP